MVAKPIVGTLVNPAHADAVGLTAAFLFNEGSGATAADSSGNGYSMALGSDLSWTTTVAFTSGAALAAALDAGTNRGVISPAIPNIPGGVGFSIEVWYRDDGSDSFAQFIGGSGNVGLKLHSSNLIWDQGTLYTGSHTINTSTVYQSVLTYDGTNFRFYTNGSLDNTVASTNTINTNPLNVANNAGSETFHGILDALFLWDNRVLSGSNISGRYATPLAMYGVVSAVSSQARRRGVNRGVLRGVS